MLNYRAMWTHLALQYYGTAKTMADAIGITASAVSQWGDVVPYYSATRLHESSDGAIPMEPGHYGPGGRIVVPKREESAA